LGGGKYLGGKGPKSRKRITGQKRTGKRLLVGGTFVYKKEGKEASEGRESQKIKRSSHKQKQRPPAIHILNLGFYGEKREGEGKMGRKDEKLKKGNGGVFLQGQGRFLPSRRILLRIRRKREPIEKDTS